MHRMRSMGALLMLLELSMGVARADSPATLPDAPATQPAAPATEADAPATQPTAPREVLRVLISALYLGKPNDIAPICRATTPQTRAVVSDMTDLAAAVEALHKAAIAKFGPDAVEAATPAMASPKTLDHATETIDGDNAVIDGEGMSAAPLIRIGGEWKVDIAGMVQRGGSTPAEAHQMLSHLADAVRETAANVSAGKYENTDAMRDALIKAQSDAVSQASQTVQSTTQP